MLAAARGLAHSPPCPLPLIGKAEHDAVNLCWYEADRQGALLDLSLAQPEGTLELDQVAGLLIAVDGNTSNTIQALNIDLRGLPDNSTHKANKALVYNLLRTLKNAGWQKYYFPSDPRIAAGELHKLDWKESLLGTQPLSHPLFDANHEMSLEQWLGNNMFYDWYLYHGNYIAHVRALRYDSKSAPPAKRCLLDKPEPDVPGHVLDPRLCRGTKSPMENPVPCAFERTAATSLRS